MLALRAMPIIKGGGGHWGIVDLFQRGCVPIREVSLHVSPYMYFREWYVQHVRPKVCLN